MREFKIKLTPTKRQEEIFWRYVGASRYTYNWGISLLNEKHKNGIKLASISSEEFTKHKNECIWLKEIADKTLRQSLRDLDNAYKLFFQGKRKHPKFKTKKKSKPIFYTRNDQVKFESDKVRFEKIGWVKYSDNREIPKAKYSNTRISFDGKYWYLTFGTVDTQDSYKYHLNDLSLGIDIGITTLATCSDGDKYENVSKSEKIKKLEKRISRKFKRFSKKENGSKNKEKLRKKIKLLYRKITNIKDYYMHNISNDIVMKLPKRIVMESLNINGMLKNKFLAKHIQKSCWRMFMTRIEYKAKKLGIQVVYADRFFPSSQICSNCGKNTGKKKLKIRKWICQYCGTHHDRDINASKNLAMYKE